MNRQVVFLTPSSTGGAQPPRKRPPEPPSGHNPNFKRIFEWAALILTLVTGTAAGLLEWRGVTQYGLVGFAALMLVWTIARERRQLSRGSKPLNFALASFATIVLGVIVSPAVWLTAVLSALFWAFVGIEYRCEINEKPASGSYAESALDKLGRLKIHLGYRHQKPSIPIRLAALAAVFGSIGTGLGATLDDHVHAVASPPSKEEAHTPPTPNPHDKGSGGGNTTTFTAPKAPLTPHTWSGHCPYYITYAGAEWATKGVHELLEDTPLGPYEVGCVERLNTEYESVHGLVWGIGVQPETGISLSIVFDDPPIGIPGIAIAPAVENVKELITKYKALAPDGPSFARYKASQGDYYLLDTYESGTCVVIRRRSGGEYEEPTYTTLVPPVAVAWLSIIKALKKWQWPIELHGTKTGTRVFQLKAAGEESPDAYVTYDPKSGFAYWRFGDVSFEYPPNQHDIAPAEVEYYVKAYLYP